MESCIKQNSKTFFINNIFRADEYFLRYSYEKNCVGGLRPPKSFVSGRASPPDALGLKLKSTGSCEVLVKNSESGLQNLLSPRNIYFFFFEK